MTVSTTRNSRLIDDPDLLRARLKEAPSRPGVYLMRDASARVAYVGKAANLRSRLRSYFTGLDSLHPRTRHLVERVFDFEVVACANEREALILENTLIKRHRPRFNVRLKDDKNYLYLKIPQPGAADVHAPGTAREGARTSRSDASAERASLFPRPYYTRRMTRDGARYFGPYTSANSLRSTVKSLRTIFPFRTCSDEVFRRGRVCLDYHIKRCSGPCEGKISPQDYAELLAQVSTFMEGHSRVLESTIHEQMTSAAERLEFEQAARLRDRLAAVGRMAQKQRMLRGSRADEDCVAVAIEAGRGMVGILAVREGRVVGMEVHEIEGVAEASLAECLGSFVAQYYGSSAVIPRTILLAEEIEDLQELRDFLTAQRGGAVDLRAPQRGSGRSLVARARETAELALRQKRVVDDYDSERTVQLLDDLAAQLNLPAPPRRIECYDISNTMGTNSVGSMVVFEDGRPDTARYRHFGIKTVEGPDDFASMRETLSRRFRRYLASQENISADVPVLDPAGSNGSATVEDEGEGTDAGVGDDSETSVRTRKLPRSAADDSFAVLPDLVLVDGGKGQLSVAHQVLVEAGLSDIPIFGLAKRNEELFAPHSSEPLILPRDSPTLFLVQRIRDEAHRFAITRHRARRGKTALQSRLDIVPGLGPARRRALLRHFGSIDAMREASVDELTAVPGVPRSVALRIKELL